MYALDKVYHIIKNKNTKLRFNFLHISQTTIGHFLYKSMHIYKENIQMNMHIVLMQ